jgi:hypothetical protein
MGRAYVSDTVAEDPRVYDVNICANMFQIRKTSAHKQMHALISRFKDNEPLEENKRYAVYFFTHQRI